MDDIAAVIQLLIILVSLLLFSFLLIRYQKNKYLDSSKEAHTMCASATEFSVT